MNHNKVYASIITIGDELLIGQTIDTNSAWMAQQLNAIGVLVKRRVAVADEPDAIRDALDEEARHSSIVLITGGLGPTADDVTKPLLCAYFGGRLVVNQAALENVKTIFSKYLNRPLLQSNLRQAEVPDVCTVIQNKRGTAPGMWFEKDGVIFVSMPGVPHEMKGMMTDYVLPRLPGIFTLPAVVHRTLLTAGIGESFLAERIKDFEAALPSHIKLAYLPNYGMVKLRLSASGQQAAAITSEVEALFAELQRQVADVLVIASDTPLHTAVGMQLQQMGKTLCTAESCTGGYLSHLITSVPGSSAYFNGAVVSYANQVKTSVLGVNAETLSHHGAVSETTVLKMAGNARTLLNADYAIAISGIMGPDGGTPEKPVGTVWIAVADAQQAVAKKFQFRFDRMRNIELTATNALNFLREHIKTTHTATNTVAAHTAGQTTSINTAG